MLGTHTARSRARTGQRMGTKMIQKRKSVFRLAALMGLMSVCINLSILRADNNLSLRLATNNVVQMDFTNTDYIEGSQFTINARGGVVLGTYENGDRANASGMELYQYLVNDSTLNVVLLAPFHAPLASGAGVLGKIHFTVQGGISTDSVRMFVSNAKFSDDNANLVQVSVGQVTWNLHTNDGAKEFVLEQNFPNPFNPATTISYSLRKPAQVNLNVFDITGREVRSLVHRYQSEGTYAVQWSAEGRQGPALASGVYIVCLQVGTQVATRKMIYAK